MSLLSNLMIRVIILELVSNPEELDEAPKSKRLMLAWLELD